MTSSLRLLAWKQVDGTGTTLTSGWKSPSGAASPYVPLPGDVIFAQGAATGPLSPTPGPPPGWTAIGAGASGDVAARGAFRVIVAGDTSSGTWTGTESLVLVAFRGAKLADALGAIAGAGGNDSTIVFPALACDVANGSSWAVAWAVHESATNVLGAIAGLTALASGDSGHHAAWAAGPLAAIAAGKSRAVNSSNNWNASYYEVLAQSTAEGAALTAAATANAVTTARLTVGRKDSGRSVHRFHRFGAAVIFGRV